MRQKIKLKGIYLGKTFETDKNLICVPVYFPKESGLQFKSIEGCNDWSCWCVKKEKIKFVGFSKVKYLYVKLDYWVKHIFWRKFRYQYPYKIKCWYNSIFNQKSTDNFPF